MRWRGGRRSSNVEDRRGSGGGGMFRIPMGRGGGGFPGGRMRIPVGRGGGIGGLGIVVLLVLFFLFGGDLGTLLDGVQVNETGTPTEQGQPRSAGEDELAQFVSVVLADTEDTWAPIFEAGGRTYQEPTLVLFSNAVRSGCGFAGAQVGPFYCPADRKLYIDLQFFADLKTRFGAPGDFAQAYVVAHEVGHHVQTLLGISEQVRAAQERASREQANAIQVRMELQADCFAGLWANHADRARQILETGDVDEALRAAAAIGDDRLQKQAQGHVVPESFTHGTSEQRARWFRRGLEQGSLSACDTFGADTL